MNLMVAIALFIGVGYAAVVLAYYVYQERLVYQPETPGREITATPASLNLDYEEVALGTQDGVRLHGWYVPAPNHRAMVLFFHGNGGNISHRLDSVSLFHRLGLSTLIIDYRGYGQSSGHASEAGTYEDSQAAWRFATAKGYGASEIVIWGRSLGAAVATQLAAHHACAALIIESTFTSIPELAKAHYPLLPVRLIARLRYDNLSRVAKITCPVLVVHSPEDQVIPIDHGQSLYRAAGSTIKDFLEISGAHGDGYATSGAHYENGVAAFLDRVLPP